MNFKTIFEMIFRKKHDAKKLIKSTNGKIFHVDFTKKDGTNRCMIARLGVVTHLKGGTKRFKDEKYNLITVFDMTKKAYRSLHLHRVNSLKINGKLYEFNRAG